jgi:hypothetical protein
VTGDQRSPPHIPDIVPIAISQAAFDAIASTMPLGSVGFPNCAGLFAFEPAPFIYEGRAIR